MREARNEFILASLFRNAGKVRSHQGPWHRHPANGILAGSQRHVAIERRLDAVFQLRFAGRARTVDAAEDLAIRFDAVSDDPAVAVRTDRRQRVDRALEAVKGVMLPTHNDFKRLVIFVLANFACSHT